jgi:hypothetical protein
MVIGSYAIGMAVSVEAQPLIAVRDVRASSRWYGELFAAGLPPDHGYNLGVHSTHAGWMVSGQCAWVPISR